MTFIRVSWSEQQVYAGVSELKKQTLLKNKLFTTWKAILYKAQGQHTLPPKQGSVKTLEPR